MKPRIPRQTGGANLKQINVALTALGDKASAASARGDYLTALQCAQQALRMAPQHAVLWMDAAVYSIKLEQWDETIQYAQRALKAKGNGLAIYDALAHAWGIKQNLEEARRWGLAALNTRDERFGGAPVLAHPVLAAPLPPAPSAQTRENNLIAFSLFGANPKYCETAVLNVLEQPAIYPHWQCVFFVDGSVPAHVLERLHNGGRVIEVTDPLLLKAPGPMWRFLAYDLPDVHRVIFRDADSVISQREAEAVQEWIDGGERFHLMRDYATHTELILAGLWGVCAGALPSMRPLMDNFLAQPVACEHFADQYFLRSWVWPYARQSLMQHDSQFGFLEARPFPGGIVPAASHVGAAEGATYFNLPIDAADGTCVTWVLHHKDAEQREICSYEGVVQQKTLSAHLPARYGRSIREGQLGIRYTLH
ncbi:tetratricopeptide repeat protein [Pseudomonas sp. SCB32]|uniref:tetratricopeptide repeat protein n=1 Tax=Pseudomonas sp. SCB32 TaxID=2653853 RepID=UPI002115B71E|nr:tetratricopeptide repeat protein [Pseudomonas sp. SCB32]